MSNRMSAGENLSNLASQLSSQVSDLMSLAKAEISPSAKNAAVGGGFFGAAGAFGLNTLRLLELTISLALAVLYQRVFHFDILVALTCGFLTMTVLGLVIAAILALRGVKRLKRISAPTATFEEAKATAEFLSTSLKNGLTDVQMGVTRTTRHEADTAYSDASQPSATSTDATTDLATLPHVAETPRRAE